MKEHRKIQLRIFWNTPRNARNGEMLLVVKRDMFTNLLYTSWSRRRVDRERYWQQFTSMPQTTLLMDGYKGTRFKSIIKYPRYIEDCKLKKQLFKMSIISWKSCRVYDLVSETLEPPFLVCEREIKIVIILYYIRIRMTAPR